jgi:hypothetical protein
MVATKISPIELTAAYRAGDAARDHGAITPDAHQLYELLLAINTKQLRYIFAGVKALAGMIGCCAKTIQRRMEQLVAAGLVWRQRQLNKPWLTYISAFAPRPEQAVFFDESAVSLEETAESSPSMMIHDSDPGGGAPAPRPPGSEQPAQPQTQPATNRRIDRQDRQSSAPAAPLDPRDSEKIALLQAAGLTDVRTIAELATVHPLDRIRRVVADVRESAGRFGAGFVAYLLRTGLDLPTRKESHDVTRRAAPAPLQPSAVAAVVERLAPGVGPCRVVDHDNLPW